VKDVKTEWFPGSIEPVHEGCYEVVVKLPSRYIVDAVYTEQAVAVWCKILDTLGFWPVEETYGYRDAQETMKPLDVLSWRGRVLPHRVKLQLELDLPRKRVKLGETS